MTPIHGPPYSPLSKGRIVNNFNTDFTGTNRAKQLEIHRGKMLWLAVPIAVTASIFIFSARAHQAHQTKVLRSHSPSPSPAYRAETLKLKAKGLLPNSTFTVFLAADRLGVIATNEDGRGSMRAEALVEGDSLSPNLRPAVLRFASPAADDACFMPVHGEVEDAPLIRKNASATTTWITSSRSINDGSIFHTINWRSIQCVSTF